MLNNEHKIKSRKHNTTMPKLVSGFTRTLTLASFCKKMLEFFIQQYKNVNKNKSIKCKQNIAMPKLVSGFTLVEMLVATAIFSTVMLIGVGALLTMVDANRKALAINSVMNNLNLALESMSRNIRTGTSYRCGTNIVLNLSYKDCNQGGIFLAFEPSTEDTVFTDTIIYQFNENNGEGWLERSIDAGNTFIRITAPEVEIENFKFYVVGSEPLSGINNDTKQPKVTITIGGTVNISERSKTTFNIQTTVSQRLLDL